MSTVYLIQQPRIDRRTGWTPDFSSAASLGTITPLLAAEDNPSILPGPSLFKIRQRLRTYTPEDFILWAGGDPMGLALTFIAFGELGLPEFQWLRWERTRNDEGKRVGGYYVPVIIQTRRKDIKDATQSED